jgi:hypothetical protein
MARAAMHRQIDNAPENEWKADRSMEKQGDSLKRLRAGKEDVQGLAAHRSGPATSSLAKAPILISSSTEAAPESCGRRAFTSAREAW